MRGSFNLGSVFCLLFIGFFLLYIRMKDQRVISGLMKNTMEKIDAETRQRLLEERKRLLDGETGDSVFQRAEKLLFYSGLKWKIPALSVEILFATNLLAVGIAALAGLLSFGRTGIFLFPAGLFTAEFLFFQVQKGKAYKSVDEDLPKFMDFLGNYSATNGELRGIFQQIAKYMGNPLSNVLEECCEEAEFTGDMSAALLSMREKIEHPQFKNLINELEINLRYCADYTVLVQSGRRSLRDYMKSEGERRGMLREAMINAVLLLGMSFFSLLAVDSLIEESVWGILFHTMPGRVSLILVGSILFLFAGKILNNGA